MSTPISTSIATLASVVLVAILLHIAVVSAAWTWPQNVAFAPPGKPSGFRNRLYNHISPAAANLWSNDDTLLVRSPARWDSIEGNFLFNILPDGLLPLHIAGENVDVYIKLAMPDGNEAWLCLARNVTTSPSGTVVFAVPQSLQQNIVAQRIYPVKLVLTGNYKMASTTLQILNPTTSTVVFDVDGTLTTSNLQLTEQIIADLLHRRHIPKVQPGVVDVVRTYWEKGYAICYLTARPGALMNITLEWLMDAGFPPGWLHLSHNMSETTGKHVQDYKSKYLTQQLEEHAGVGLFALYGNAKTDVDAYLQTKVPPERIFIIGTNGGYHNSTALKSFTEHLLTVKKYPGASVPGPKYESKQTF